MSFNRSSIERQAGQAPLSPQLRPTDFSGHWPVDCAGGLTDTPSAGNIDAAEILLVARDYWAATAWLSQKAPRCWSSAEPSGTYCSEKTLQALLEYPISVWS